MSEPVVWMQSDHLDKFRHQACGSQSMLVRCSDHKSQSDFKPLYDADAIERKDAAIAELVLRLKDCAEAIVYYEKITTIKVNYPTLDNAITVIKKYDTPKDGL